MRRGSPDLTFIEHRQAAQDDTETQGCLGLESFLRSLIPLVGELLTMDSKHPDSRPTSTAASQRRNRDPAGSGSDTGTRPTHTHTSPAELPCDLAGVSELKQGPLE